MYILGLNATMHDSSAALLRGGRVVAFAEQERFDRRKHSDSFPVDAIEFCLSEAGVKMRDVAAVGFFWVPWKGLDVRLVQLTRLNLRKPWRRDRRGFLPTNVRIFLEMLAVPLRLRAMGFRGRFRFIDHYDTHFASALGPSGLVDPAFLILDGNGETLSTQWGVVDAGVRRVLGSVRYPHSLGQLYGAVTEYLGFRARNGEAKVMGLASYGEPRYVDEFYEIITPGDAGSYSFDMRYFDYHISRREYVTRPFIDLFGARRAPESEILQRHKDIAASLQSVVEERTLAIARSLREAAGRRPLIVVGGVALNSVLNGKLRREADFDEVWIPPWAGDQGGALGAAVVAAQKLDPTLRVERVATAALGPEYSDKEIVKALRLRALRSTRVTDSSAEAARRIAAGQVVGWFQGRSEVGPRALGYRSILADPRSPTMKDRLNARVKHREGFRPFAPAVLAARAPDWFETDRPSPWMLFVERVRAEKQALIPAVTHVDGTARVQTVDGHANPKFARLIEAFEDITGVPVVLNTSFNIRGEPIVQSPLNAIDCFLRTGIDALIIGDHMIEKACGRPSAE